MQADPQGSGVLLQHGVADPSSIPKMTLHPCRIVPSVPVASLTDLLGPQNMPAQNIGVWFVLWIFQCKAPAFPTCWRGCWLISSPGWGVTSVARMQWGLRDVTLSSSGVLVRKLGPWSKELLGNAASSIPFCLSSSVVFPNTRGQFQHWGMRKLCSCLTRIHLVISQECQLGKIPSISQQK